MTSEEFLSRAIPNLLLLYDHFEEQRRQAEIICKDCRSVFCPWPRKIQRSVIPEVKAEGEKALDCTESGSAHDRNGEDVISHREKAELALVDELLLKAQKARDIQTKISENKSTRPHKGIKPKSQLIGRNPTGPLKTTTKDNVEHLAKNDKLVDASAPTQKSARKATVDTRVKYQQAHTNAPFKTNPNLHKKKLTRPKSADRRISKVHSNEQTATTKSRDASAGSDSSKRTSVFTSSTPLQPIDTTKTLCVDENRNGDVDNPSWTSDGRAAGVVTSPQERVPSSSISPRNQKEGVTPPSSVGDDRSQDEFFLCRDGSKLAMPGKLKKLFHMNMKLRENLASTHLTVPLDKPNRAKTFLEKFEHSLSTSSDKQVQLHRSVLQLKEEYQSVASLLTEAQLEDLSDKTCAKDVLKTKIILADVLSRFYSMEEEFQLIQRALKKKASLSSESVISVDRFREQVPGFEDIYKNKEIPSQCEQFQYRSFKKLTQFITLQGQVDALQIEKHILGKTSSEILDFLNTVNPQDSCFNETYRSGYAMLCSSGRHFPTMVKDALSSEDSEG